MTGYFDERSIYEQKRRGSRRLLLIMIASALLFGGGLWHYAHAQQVKRGVIAICSERADAEALLDKMVEGGQSAGIEWMQEPSNSCALTRAMFKMGQPLGVAKKVEGKDWVVVPISPPDESSHDFSVVPLSAVTLAGA